MQSRVDDSALPPFLAGVMLFDMVALALRALDWTLSSPGQDMLTPSMGNVLFQAYQLALAVIVPTVFLLLAMQRLNRELRSSERELRDLADRYDLAISAAEIGVWDLDFTTRRLLWDERMYAIYRVGREQTDDLIAAWRAVVHPEDRDAILAELHRATVEGVGFDLEFRILRPEGGVRYVRARARGIGSTTGAGRRLVGVSYDVTAVRQAEKALREAVRKLNLLSAITRHDLQNQLTALRGWLDLADEQSGGDALLARALAQERAVVNRLDHIVEFTREYQDLGLHSPCWQDLGAVVAHAIDEVRPPFPVRIDGLDRVEVYADPLLPRVFYNLIENVVRHGGIVRGLSIGRREESDRLVVTLEDDGRGVPADEKERVFERGYGRNTGLGLFMAREALDLTGIAIAETGEQGAGARFEITVPRGAWRIRGDA